MSTEHTPEVTPEAEGLEDFDAFWSSRKRKRKATPIMGEVVTLPSSLPLQFELEARKVQRSRKDKDVRKLVAILFGEDALERWAKRGMDMEQFMVLLAWAPRAIAGDPVTLQEVADEVAKALEADEANGGEGSGEA